MKTIIHITEDKNNNNEVFDSKEDALTYISQIKGQDDSVNQTYNKKVWGVRHINYHLSLNEEKRVIRLDKEAIATALEYLTDSFDARLAQSVLSLRKTGFKVASLRQIAVREGVDIPPKSNKAQITMMIAKSRLTAKDIETMQNIDRHSLDELLGDEE